MKKIIVVFLILFTLQTTNVNAQTLRANDVSVKISGTSQWLGTLNIGLIDAEDCTAVAFRISFPNEIGNSDIGTPIDMTHSLYSYENKYMFLNDDNQTLAKSMELMSLSISATSDASGVYLGRVTDIELVTKDFQLITLPDVSFTVSVDNETDAVTGISSDSDDEEQIYSVSGIRQNQLQNGVNIIYNSDGTIKKVLK